MTVKYSSTGIRHVSNGEAVNETVLKRPSEDLEHRTDEVSRAVNQSEAIALALTDYVISTGSGTASIEVVTDDDRSAIGIPNRGKVYRLNLGAGGITVVGKSGEFELRVSQGTLNSHYDSTYTGIGDNNAVATYNKENYLSYLDPNEGGQATGPGTPYKDQSTCIVMDNNEFYNLLQDGKGLGSGGALNEHHIKKLPLYNRISLDTTHEGQGGFIDRNGPGGVGEQLFDNLNEAGTFYPVLERADYGPLYVSIESVSVGDEVASDSKWHAKGFRGGQAPDNNAITRSDMLKVIGATNDMLFLEETSCTRGNTFSQEESNIVIKFFAYNNVANVADAIEEADAGFSFEKAYPMTMDLTDKVVIPLVTMVSGEKFVFGTKSGILTNPNPDQVPGENMVTPLSSFKLPISPVEQFSGTMAGQAGTDLVNTPLLESALSDLKIPAGTLTDALRTILSIMSTRDITTRNVYTPADLATNTTVDVEEFTDNDDDLNSHTRVKEVVVSVDTVFSDNDVGDIYVHVEAVTNDDGAGAVAGILGSFSPYVTGRSSFSVTRALVNGVSTDISNMRVVRIFLQYGQRPAAGSFGLFSVDVTYNALANIS